MPTNLAVIRGSSHYPVYRAIVGLLTVAGYVIAIAFAAASFLLIDESALALGLGFGAAILTVLLTHLVRETCLMFADAADAIVRTAELSPAEGKASGANLDWPAPMAPNGTRATES